MTASCVGRSGHGENERGGEHREGDSEGIRTQGPAHTPQRLRHHRDHDRLEALEKSRGNRIVEGEHAVAERNHHDCGGCGEAQPGRERSRKAGLLEADSDADLARARSRKHLAQGDEIGEAALLRPGTAHHELFAEVADVRYRTSEGREPEPQEGEEDRRGGRPCFLAPGGLRVLLHASRQLRSLRLVNSRESRE